MTITSSSVLRVTAIYNGESDVLDMTFDELSDWVHYNYAYDEYDSILVDGVEASDLV